MERSGAPVPFLTTEEYFQLIEEAAFHLAYLRGFKNCALPEDWWQAEQRILNVISGVAVQYDGNTRLRR
jgi:hypothetical protein